MADQILLDIKDRLNIVDVISGYIPLKKAGVNYKAPCPFHNEKTPSLVVSPQKQIWHCFGCGEGGDIFGFVMRYENLEFRDTLKLLAEKAGVKLPEYQPQSKEQVDEREQLLRINDFAARFFYEILTKNKNAESARHYLKNRGLSKETIEKWKIGFAPEDFHALEHALVKKSVPLNDLVKAGVSVKNEKGQMYDRFRGRITFPIFNAVGEIVGFSARILSGDAQAAKYVNSPETPIYNKSRVLFGFNFAKADIRKADEAIVVEGQMDCISAHQAGIANVVASSGTALTTEQMAQLSRFTKNIKFCFDADAAGLTATKRAVENFLGKGFSIKIITLSGAKDPDELIKKDPKEFQRQVAKAPLFLDYYISKQFEQFGNSFEEKNKVRNELLPLLNLLQDPLERDHYMRVVAERLGTTPHVLLEDLNKLKKPVSGTVSASEKQPRNPEGVNSLEKEVLGGMLLYPDFREKVLKEGSGEDFLHEESKELAKKLLSDPQHQDGSTLAKEAIFMVESALDESSGGQDALQRQLLKAFALLRKNAIRHQQKELASRIKQAEQQKQKQVVLELNQQFASLSKLLVEFEKML